MEKKKTLYFSYQEYTFGGEICEGEEDDAWPNHEDTDIEFYLTGCNLTSDKAKWCKECRTVNFLPKEGMSVWTVVVRYGTGGTFGHTNGAWTFIGVYDSKKEAELVSSSIYDNSYEGYKCWEGYFENLECVEVTELIVKS